MKHWFERSCNYCHCGGEVSALKSGFGMHSLGRLQLAIVQQGSGIKRLAFPQ